MLHLITCHGHIMPHLVELLLLLYKFVDFACFKYFIICVIVSHSGCRFAVNFIHKWLILYERSVKLLYDQAIKFYTHHLEMCTQCF